jgi:hypothetical protein
MKAIKFVAVTSTMVFGLFLLMDMAFTGSDVYKSHSTGACVKVENLDGIFFTAGNYTCDNLPEKYSLVYVK